MIPIELLAPAKNLEYGKAAILHGADAVYIGAPHFGARADASNSINDIEQLVRYAHLYNAKVYVALNTILYDNEIDVAVRLSRQLYETGIDALIIQDMGLLQCELPPLPLYASTQTHNYSIEKIVFLEKVGFQRVILARELSIPEIEQIRQHTHIELECFVHGALCVSYSGQCYMSQAIAQRSGNRGVCAQPCRSAYSLLDATGKTIIKDAHMLSLKDLNLSGHLSGLLKAGITSFKIEGRLKDLNYVKNITAFYRKHLDEIIENNENWKKSSSGNVCLHFTPDPYKTFNRGYTTYFIGGRTGKVASPQTQKSTGEYLGVVSQVLPQWFMIDTRATVSNGDGLCWLHSVKGLEGVLVNRVEGNKIFPAKPLLMKVGTKIYRNNDFLFEKQLAGNSADRRIAVSFELCEREWGYVLCAVDEDRNRVEYSIHTQKLPAKNPILSRKHIDVQLRKLGNTAFVADQITIPETFAYFMLVAEINEMRRQVLQQLENYRIKKYRPKNIERIVTEVEFPEKSLGYYGNVANHCAKDFYRQHGVQQIDDAFELQGDYRGKTLMTTKHCIKYQYNMCPKQHPVQQWKEPLFLKDNHFTYKLEFDCRVCEMKIKSEN